MPSLAAIKAGAAFVELSLKRTAFENGLVAAQRSLQSFSASFLRVGSGLIGIGAGIGVPLGIAAKQFSDFDDLLRFIDITSKDAGSSIGVLEERFRNLGKTTSFTLSQIGEAGVELSKAGFAKPEIDQSIQSVLNLARATRSELSLAADTAAKVLRGFGLEVSEIDRVVDVLTKTTTNSAQSLEDLFESIKLVTSYGRSGEAQNLEEIAAALGELANAGLTGSLAGTSLRRIFTNLATKSDEIKQLTNVDTTDSQGNLRNFVDVLEEMTAALSKLGTGDQVRILNEVFEVRGLQGARLIGQGLEPLKQFINELRNAGGTAQKVSDYLDSGLGGAIRKMLSAFEEFVNQVGKAISGPLEQFLGYLRTAIDFASVFVSRNKKMVQAIAAVAAGFILFGSLAVSAAVALGILGFAVSSLVVLSTLATGIGAVAVAFGPMLSVVGMAVVALTALGAIVIDLIDGWSLFNGVLKAVEKTFIGIQANLNVVFKNAESSAIAITAAWQLASIAVTEAWVRFLRVFINGTSAGITAISTLLVLLSSQIEGIANISSKFAGKIFQRYEISFNSFINAIRTGVLFLANYLEDVFEQIFVSIDSIINKLISKIEIAINSVITAYNTVANRLNPFGGKGIDLISIGGVDFKDQARNLFKGLKDAAAAEFKGFGLASFFGAGSKGALGGLSEAIADIDAKIRAANAVGASVLMTQELGLEKAKKEYQKTLLDLARALKDGDKAKAAIAASQLEQAKSAVSGFVSRIPTSSAGTFSAAAAGRLGVGTPAFDQLKEARKANNILDRQFKETHRMFLKQKKIEQVLNDLKESVGAV